MLEETTLTMVRSLAAQLNPAERLKLIRAITETDAPVPSAQAIDDRLAWRAKLTDEAAFWHARSAEERKSYLGKYVAVHQHSVVDHDADLRALHVRVRQRFPRTPVLLTAAEAQAPREYTFLSPRLEHIVQ